MFRTGLVLLALACRPAPPACGDGQIDRPFEACDDGDANGFEAGACRPDCTLPACGDGILDPDEACDDGDTWGGDGCSPDCAIEEGMFEAEPNDSWDQATALFGPGFGSLPEGDEDCWSFDVPELGYVRATIGGASECADARVLAALRGPGGAWVGTAALEPQMGCGSLDPVRHASARYLPEGRYSLCLSPLSHPEVRGYRIEVETGEACSLTEIPFLPEDDADGDGVPNICDDDSDGDGILDVDDNCPYVKNAGDPVELWPDVNGFLRTWLAVGPLTGIESEQGCLPTGDRLEPSDATAEPVLVSPVEDRHWRVLSASGDRVGLESPFAYVDAPREAYLAAWVFSPSERPLGLSVGPDDGARVWLNGEVVIEDDRCQGTRVDRNVHPVVLLEGWNALLLKIYDQGGGWGAYVRFLDPDGPVTDLLYSIEAGRVWTPDQTDTDGDGVGDVCDPFPAG